MRVIQGCMRCIQLIYRAYVGFFGDVNVLRCSLCVELVALPYLSKLK